MIQDENGRLHSNPAGRPDMMIPWNPVYGKCRFIIVDGGVGVFHYSPTAEQPVELRSVIVQTGNVVAFAPGLIHTFTAPLVDLILLSYHAPFIDLGDSRQLTIRNVVGSGPYRWSPGDLLVADWNDNGKQRRH